MRPYTLVPAVFVLGLASACGADAPPPAPIVINGSSTVYPLTRRAAQDYQKRESDQVFTIGFSSTGAGLQQLCAGTLDIADASRPITPGEVQVCDQAKISFLEVPIAYDAVTVVVHPSNEAAISMTTDELKKLWSPEAQGKVTRWSQIRKGWPDREIHLFGPDSESGTFDFFTQAIVGQAKRSRTDYTANTDDAALADAVAKDPDALAYFGYTYFAERQDVLKAVPIDDMDQHIAPGAIAPSPSNVRRGTYQPLSRPLFLYVKATALDRPEVRNFLTFFTRNAEQVAAEVGGVSLGLRVSQLVEKRVEGRVLGTVFIPPPKAGQALETLLGGGGL